MTVASMDGMIASFPAYPKTMWVPTFTPQAIGSFVSLLPALGIPGPGANATSGVAGDVPTDATPGAYPFTNPTPPARTYLSGFHVWASIAGTIVLYDRLWQNSGLSPTTVGAQTVNSVALTRPDANGDAVEAWFQVYTNLGVGGTAKTISYTNQAGVSGRTGTLVGFSASWLATRAQPFSLAAGDTGVRSIQSFDNVATSTSGTFGLILRRKIVSVSASASQGVTLDGIQLGMPRIYDDACLEFIWIASAVSTNTLSGSISLAQG